MIKNISKSEQGAFHSLRFNLVSPGGTSAKELDQLPASPNHSFLKEITFKTMDANQVGNGFRAVKEMQKKAKAEETERKELKDLVEQPPLQLNKTRTQPRLTDLLIRPPLAAKRR
jgi:nucleosome binding factor SPN SPT16 subunit